MASTWLVGTNPVPGGFGIFQWNFQTSNWDPIDGGAVRIACGGPEGTPWVVNDLGEIYQRVP
ncbi:hypothetical protein QTH97_35445 [Variovorax sp. J22R24]|uniref:hypothetical protein n=1 Tax=Variovorax gracilis TaxID=3053502 RepID=UPI0025764ADA|nr:hypothetical protein [Variovorax sp. J22R24]MDM0110231.1 hypothetical protein [Variovorax sp. J22R24]